jgi:hypothetical protein
MNMKYRERYGDNWEAIALEIKTKANWICQKCGKQCIHPGEETSGLDNSEKAAKTLTVHHLDRIPENSEPSNLIAVCTACHLAYHRCGLGNVSPGQLELFPPERWRDTATDTIKNECNLTTSRAIALDALLANATLKQQEAQQLTLFDTG